MATLMEQRDAAKVKAEALVVKAKSGEITDEQVTELNALVEQVKHLDGLVGKAGDAERILAGLGAPADKTEDKPSDPSAGPADPGAKSLGHYAVKGMAPAFQRIKQGSRVQADLPEFVSRRKAAGDVTTTGNAIGSEAMQRSELDTNIVKQYVERPIIADWLGAGTLSRPSITYYVEKAWDAAKNGKFGMVGENERKPGLTPPDYTEVTENLKKIAGWIKLSMEMSEDYDFLVSEINNRLLFQLLLFEEDALLNGDGKGQNVNGLLNREGVQQIVSKGSDVDAIFQANTAIFTKTNLRADGLIIHPMDYQRLRLSKDGNGQYIAGGPFTGQYGNGGILQDPPLWGLKTIQSTAVPEGKALIGAGKTAATVYRKGGVRVETSNVDGEDFTHNRFTILAEERLTLAVRRPDAFAQITFGNGDEGKA